MVNPDLNKSHGRLEIVARYADISSKVVGILAVVLGAAWTYWQFTITNANSETLSLVLSPHVVSTGTGDAMIVADVYLKNIGRSPIRPNRGLENSPGEGCELTVIEYAGLPSQVDPEGNGAVEPAIIDWWEGDDSSVLLVEKYNLLGTYASFSKGTYVINPGQEFHEAAVIPVKKGRLYGIRARFFSDENWTEADIRYSYVPSE